MGTFVNHEHVRARRHGAVGRITLDRPLKLNALTHHMVRDIHAILDVWENDSDMHYVLLDGAGDRGLCAGGDIGILWADLRDGRDSARTFWADQYRLNARIARSAKPIIAFMPGIVMGGGVGLSSHARYRIVTESTRLAMPETHLGLIPDVGATWLLSRAPGELGTYLALSGSVVGAADAIALGLADFFVPSTSLEPLVEEIAKIRGRDDDALRATVHGFASAPPGGRLANRKPLIDRAFAYYSVEEIVAALGEDTSAFARETVDQIRANSPTSLKITLRALREARELESLEDCLRVEYRLMCRLLHRHDFREGARAAVIDKDRTPMWQPSDLEHVSQADVDAYFTKDDRRD